MIKCVVFDFDGTLADTLQDLNNATNDALKENGFKISYSYEEQKSLVGMGIKNLCKRAIAPFTDSEEEINKVYNSFLKTYERRQTETTKPYEGIVDLLKWIKNQNILIAVLSNKKDENTKKICSSCFDMNLFDYVYGQHKDVPLKPNPESLYILMKHFNLNKDEILYVGDSDTDMITASNASLKKIAVTWGFRDKEILEKFNPDYLVNSPSEIKNIIEMINK